MEKICRDLHLRLRQRACLAGGALIGGETETRGARSQLGEVTRPWRRRGTEGVRGESPSDKLGEELSPRSRRIRDPRTGERNDGGRERDERQRERKRKRERERQRPRKRGCQGASARDPLDTRTTHRSTVPQPPSLSRPANRRGFRCRYFLSVRHLLPPPPPLPRSRSSSSLPALHLRKPHALCPSIRPSSPSPISTSGLLSLIKPRSPPPPPCCAMLLAKVSNRPSLPPPLPLSLSRRERFPLRSGE